MRLWLKTKKLKDSNNKTVSCHIYSISSGFVVQVDHKKYDKIVDTVDAAEALINYIISHIHGKKRG